MQTMLQRKSEFSACRGVDDIYWHGTERKREKEAEYREYRDTRDRLITAGFEVTYGGTKGHGFWIADHVKPDDGETGNPHFWSVGEAGQLLAGKPDVLPIYRYDDTSGSPRWGEFIAAMRSGEPVEIDEEMWDYWLEILPPVFMGRSINLARHPQVVGSFRQVHAVFGFAEGEEPVVAFWKVNGRRYCCQTPTINKE
jgi:hypothetical protein